MFTHLKSLAASPIIGCLILIFAVIPTIAVAATWQELQDARIAAENNRANLSQQEKNALSRTLIPLNVSEAQFNELIAADPTYFDDALNQLRSFSGSTATERSTTRAKAIADTAAKNGGTNAPTKCNFDSSWTWGGLGSFFNPVCWFRFLSALLSTFFVGTAAMLLTVAGTLFETTLQLTVVDFGKFYNAIRPAVEQGWTLIRDFTNILIIGVFTYVAISMIIGNTTFGTKRMVAQVLLVATLINFSLLFTMIVIDMSHFVAREIYAATVGSRPANSTITQSGTNAEGASASFQTSGISNEIMKFAGMSGVFDTWSAIRGAQETGGDSGLLYAFLAITFFFAATVVLLYGSFLFLARVIVLVILLIGSSLAFATWLIPPYDKTAYGWQGWWNSLLNNAIFAPLLMLLLWLTINISQTMNSGWAQLGYKQGTLGALAAAPIANVGALVQFLFVLGLFATALFVANSFSAKLASNVSAKMTGGVLAGTTGTALSFWSQRRQKRAYDRAGERDDEISRHKQQRLVSIANGDTAGADAATKKIAQLKKLQAADYKAAKKDYNFFNKKPVANFMKAQTGLTGLAAGQTVKKSYEETVKAKAKEREEQFASAQLTKDDKKGIRAEAAKQYQEKVPDHVQKDQEYQRRLADHAQKVKEKDQVATARAEAQKTFTEKEGDAKRAFSAEKNRIEQALGKTRSEIRETAEKLKTETDAALVTQLQNTLAASKAQEATHVAELAEKTKAGHETDELKELRSRTDMLRRTEAAADQAARKAGASVQQFLSDSIETSITQYEKSLRATIQNTPDRNVGKLAAKGLDDRIEREERKKAADAYFGAAAQPAAPANDNGGAKSAA